ncbi:MAG: GMC family oxidoreductase [Gemmatimonadales bacterium]|nr:GMC family oxidoreductase [Gemmatimonadales bacterium]
MANDWQVLWSWERRFLTGWAQACLGLDGAEGLRRSEEAVRRLDQFLSAAPSGLRLTFHAALLLMPPGLFPGIITKLRFAGRTFDQRTAYVKKLHAQYVHRPPGLLFDDQAILSTVKSMLGGAYAETGTFWHSLSPPYRPRPSAFPVLDGKPVVPPSGPDLVPGRTAVGQELHRRKTTLAAVAAPSPARKTIVIVGAGAAGITAAHAIAGRTDSQGVRLILLEQGKLVVNDEFPTTTLDGFTQLYINAGVTPSQSQRIGFIQGRCVGGGSTVNNAGSPRPENRWKRDLTVRWASLGADIDWGVLDQSFDDLRRPLQISQVPEWLPTPGANRAFEGLQKLGGPWARGYLNANFLNCVGCGQCNQGCLYDAHRTPHITLLPEAFAGHAQVELVPEVTVTGLEFTGRGSGRTVTGVKARDANGEQTLRPDAVILTAGAFASTNLLLDSGFISADNRRRLVGERFSCNYASPVIGRFAARQDAGRGVQIGYIMEIPEERLIIETAFAPPTVVGMMLPQLGDQFERQLAGFDHLAVSFPTLGSDAVGRIDRSLMPGTSHTIDFELDPRDWRRLGLGLAMCARAMGLAGASEIFDSRYSAEIVPMSGDPERDQKRIDEYYRNFGRHTFVRVQSAHLQGGNVMHRDPTRGVVDAGLKVHGVDNLWVFDSSVFPSATTLNIQYTTMAMARYGVLRMPLA